MEAIIIPGKLKGSLHVPPSKSITQRALAASLLHDGRTTINNPGFSSDELAALDIIIQLGAIIREQTADRLEIFSEGTLTSTGEINCGESGLAARLFTPIAAISDDPISIIGYGTLLNRSMKPFADILPQLNVKLTDFFGRIPFVVEGPLLPASIKMDGALSSQYLTGVLFALAFTARKTITVDVDHLKSKPYIDLTLEVLEQFGRKIIHRKYNQFIVDPGLFEEKEHIVINIESDWSSAAFWLVAGAINGELRLEGLNIHSKQADIAILTALEMAGADIHIGKQLIKVSSTSPLKAFRFDATDTPDLFPVLAVLALFCEGRSHIEGMHRLKHKESDRAQSICDILDAFGTEYVVLDDALQITGGTDIRGGIVNGHNDHRIVMAATVAALKAKEGVTIQTAEAISKSYPQFFDHLSSLGARCDLKTI